MEQPDFREFRNDQIHVLMKEKPGCVVRLEITTSKEAVAAAYEKAHHAVKKQVVLPGFRKGKAPDEIIRNKYRDFVDREARDVLKSLALKEAVELVKREPFSQNAIRKADLKRASMEEGAQLLFEYEAHPVVPDIDLSKIQLNLIAPEEVKEEAIDAGFQMLLEQVALFSPIEGRALEADDYAIVDIDVLDDPAHNLVTDRRIRCAPGYAAEWLLPALLGMHVDESREVEAPEETKEATKMRRCRVTLKKLLQGTLPEETPENLEKLNCNSFSALKARVRRRYQENAHEAVQEEMRKQLKNELIRHFAFDLPQSLVQAETQARVNCWGPQAKNSASLPHETPSVEEFKREVLEEVKRYFTLMYLLRKKSTHLALDFSQKDIMSEMTHQLVYTPLEKRIVITDDVESTRHRIYMNVMMMKVEDWILGQLQGQESSIEKSESEHVCSEGCTHHHH